MATYGKRGRGPFSFAVFEDDEHEAGEGAMAQAHSRLQKKQRRQQLRHGPSSSTRPQPSPSLARLPSSASDSLDELSHVVSSEELAPARLSSGLDLVGPAPRHLTLTRPSACRAAIFNHFASADQLVLRRTSSDASRVDQLALRLASPHDDSVDELSLPHHPASNRLRADVAGEPSNRHRPASDPCDATVVNHILSSSGLAYKPSRPAKMGADPDIMGRNNDTPDSTPTPKGSHAQARVRRSAGSRASVLTPKSANLKDLKSILPGRKETRRIDKSMIGSPFNFREGADAIMESPKRPEPGEENRTLPAHAEESDDLAPFTALPPATSSPASSFKTIFRLNRNRADGSEPPSNRNGATPSPTMRDGIVNNMKRFKQDFTRRMRRNTGVFTHRSVSDHNLLLHSERTVSSSCDEGSKDYRVSHSEGDLLAKAAGDEAIDQPAIDPAQPEDEDEITPAPIEAPELLPPIDVGGTMGFSSMNLLNPGQEQSKPIPSQTESAATGQVDATQDPEPPVFTRDHMIRPGMDISGHNGFHHINPLRAHTDVMAFAEAPREDHASGTVSEDTDDTIGQLPMAPSIPEAHRGMSEEQRLRRLAHRRFQMCSMDDD